MKCYIYAKCSTCRDALKWLAAHDLEVEVLPIRETPPSTGELAFALEKIGDIRKLLNTSGMEYRAMGLKEKIDAMPIADVFGLIQANGNLCKRPFLIDQKKGIMLCGFRGEKWEAQLLDR